MLWPALHHSRSIPALFGLLLLALSGCRSPEPAGTAPGEANDQPQRRRGSNTVPTVAGPQLDRTKALRRIAFGSCVDQNKPQPVWEPLSQYDPQLFLMLGDNVYADAEEPAMFVDAYQRLADNAGFASFRGRTPFVAIWDDHDYGRNDAGQEYPLKKESQQYLLDFFDEPADSVRRTREGLYDAFVVGPEGQRVQIIVLDTRYFRTTLTPISPSRYRNYDGDDATMLGEAQWRWLQAQLQTPAELRLLVSSVQVVSDTHDRERWGVFPQQRQRLLKLIGDSKANGLIVLSGDRHRGEVSRLEGSAVGYPLYDVTSSSLNRPAPEHEDNPTRVGDLVTVANYATIDVVWEGQAHVVVELHDERGAPLVRRTIALDELQP